MTFTINNLINSLAGVLKAKYPEYPVYTSPNQQGTNVPCFFIFLMPIIIPSFRKFPSHAFPPAKQPPQNRGTAS